LRKLAIVVSQFNEPITDKLLKGALQAISDKGIDIGNIDVYKVPGAYEIPVTLKNLTRSLKEYDGLIALGCLIKGETAHFEYICGPVSDAITQISCEWGKPIGFGVLTCFTAEQAYERSLDDPITAERNKGYECAATVLEMIDLLEKIK
jgi:6,7-dimethyl-8-ribityllumazine synthase